jgi:HEAT repeat protein
MKRFFIAFLLFSSPAAAQTDTLRIKADSLFIRASNPQFQQRDLVDPSKQTLRHMPEAIPYLVEKLSLRDARERRALIDILGKMPDALLPVCSAAAGPDRDIVKTACEILAMLRDTVKEGPAATPYLLKARLHPEMQARGYATIALGKWGGEGAREALLESLADSVNFVRVQAASALGYLQDAAAIPNLIGALEDEYYGVRFAAVHALVKFKNASLPRLYKALESEKLMTRRLAAEALGKLKAPDAVAALFPLLKNADWADRLTAIEALAQLGTPAAKKLLVSHREKEPLVKTRMEELLKK